LKTIVKKYTLPKSIYDKINNEAKRRLAQFSKNQLGKRLIGGVQRDVICVAVYMSIEKIEKLSLEEFKELCKKTKSKS